MNDASRIPEQRLQFAAGARRDGETGRALLIGAGPCRDADLEGQARGRFGALKEGRTIRWMVLES